MPRTVRNFWINATIEGQKTKLSGGPKAKEGGLRVKILQRNKGAVDYDGIEVTCVVIDNMLVTTVYKNGVSIASYETER